MRNKWKEYQLTLGREVGEEVACNFVQSLLVRSGKSEQVAEAFFYELGRAWGPLVGYWAEWVQRKSCYEAVALILRDAKPLGALSVTEGWKRLYLNRANCGIADELSGGALQTHPLLEKYLAQSGCSDPFTFVDSGCYGSIVLELHRRGLVFQPLFFFSKNPSIPGFLNEIGVGQAEGTILNDSFECAFPNTHQRPSSFAEKDGIVSVDLLPADKLSGVFGSAALKGIRDSEGISCGSAMEEVQKLLRLSQDAKRGFFTGILPHESPEWSRKDEFLRSWPCELAWV